MFHELEENDGLDTGYTKPRPHYVRVPGPSTPVGLPDDPDESPRKPHVSEVTPEKKRNWRRVKRRIYSPFWRAMHNLIAHPMLAIYRPVGEWLHAYTAEQMYKPRGGLSPIITDND